MLANRENIFNSPGVLVALCVEIAAVALLLRNDRINGGHGPGYASGNIGQGKPCPYIIFKFTQGGRRRTVTSL